MAEETRRRTGAGRPRDRYGRPVRAGKGAAAADRTTPARFTGSIVEAFDAAVELFDDERFFEAHEMFEYIWNHGPSDERSFWKAMAQFAAGLCHCQRGNAAGALALLARSAGVLAAHRSPFRGVDVQALLAEGRRLAELIASRGASPELRFPSLPQA